MPTTRKAGGKRRHLTESGHVLGLGVCGRVSLVHRGGLLATCLPTIVVGTGTEKAQETR